MATFLIRQMPDDYSESTGLSKYNRSRMPGCKDKFQAYQDLISGRYTTGLSDEQVVKYSKGGRNYDEYSDFWETFTITIEADSPKVFNTENPMDDISISMLIANNYVAPNKEAISDPKYKDCYYYLYTEESESKEEITRYKLRDKAISELLKISNDKDKMLLYGQYLEGIKYNSKLKEDTLFKMLRLYIEDKDLKNADRFLEVIKTPIEEIQQKIIIDRALKHRLIQRVNLGNKKYVYQYGQITVGNVIEDVYKNMISPDFAPEFLAIKKELDSK